MAALALAIVFALASAQAPQVALEMTLAFAQDDSALDPLAVHDNTQNRSYVPRSLDSAITLACELIRNGDDLDLGLLAINLSIKAGARVENYQQCLLSLKGDAALRCMASVYNTGNAARSLS